MGKYELTLQKNPLFAGIEAEELKLLLGCLNVRERRYAKNQFIFFEGDAADRIGCVLSGSVQIMKEDYFGARNIIATIGPDELFGEAFAAAAIDALPLSVIASEESRILLIALRPLLTSCPRSCAFHHTLIQNFVRILARKNLSLIQKIEHVSKRSTREKVLSYLSSVAKARRSDRFTIPFNRQELADYLCADRSALSAVLSKLQDEGIIDFNRSDFTIRHAPEI